MSIATNFVSKWSQSVVDALVASGRLDRQEADRVLQRAGAEGLPVLSILANEGLVTMADGLACLSAISGVRTVDIVAESPDPEARSSVPVDVGRQYRVVGHRVDDGRVMLACAEPLGVAELRAVATSLGRGLLGCVLADPSSIDELIEADEARRYSEPAQPLPTGHAASTAPLSERVDRFGFEDSGALRFSRADLSGGAPAQVAKDLGTASPVVSSPARDAHSMGLDLDSLLNYAVENGASDLHLAEGFPPAVRIDGAIRRLEGMAPLDSNELRRMVFEVLPQVQRERYEATKELDTSHMIPGVGRFRVSVFQQRGSVGAVLRMIPSTIPPFDSLGIPSVVASFAEMRHGLVLVTGPTGSGKSTTLASIVDIVNQAKPLHIMTVEDPIEFLHSHGQSIVNQREVGNDTQSFGECLRHVLRQDPDVILVGELRDLETISTALTAAETGHLVFATLHTQDAPQTIDRIIDVFPPNQQDQVRIQLAGALEAVVTQQLVLAASGIGRVPVVEIMTCTAGIRNLIRTGKTHQVYSLMQTGGQHGMQTMDQALATAVSEHKITEAMAYDRARDPKQLRDYLKG